MVESYLHHFYEWEKWEGLMHNLLLILGIYIVYLFARDKQNRTMINILLFTIIIAIDTLIHQNLNIRNGKATSYI
jgi:hypothetical protein